MNTHHGVSQRTSAKGHERHFSLALAMSAMALTADL
jgi:hypothetical protein